MKNSIIGREAAESDMDMLAIACPNCLTILEDAVGIEGPEEKPRVRDISEIAYDVDWTLKRR